MRPMPYATMATLLIATAFACSPRDRQETASRADTAAEDVRDAADDAADEVRDASRDARDYAYAERTDFRRDIDLRLKGLDNEIVQLERDTKRGVDKGRDSLLVNIRTARRAVDRDLDRLGAATENEWNDIKSDVNGSVYALQEAVRRARPDARPMGGTGPQ
jgi:hypothetical protein